MFLRRLLFISCTLILLSSCSSEFQKAVNSTDFEYKYNVANKLYDAGSYETAKVLYDEVRGHYRSSVEFQDILFKYAKCNFEMGDYVFASHYFNQFATTYTTNSQREEAAFLSAYSDYSMSGSYRLDQESTTAAIEKFQEYINTFSNSPRIGEANKLMDEMRGKLEIKDFESANLYFKTSDYVAAMHSFDNFVRKFPDSEYVELARFNLAKANYQLASQSLISKQKERFESTINNCKYFIRKFPDSDYAKEATAMIETATNKLKLLKENDRY